jgi:hypothetical protein
VKTCHGQVVAEQNYKATGMQIGEMCCEPYNNTPKLKNVYT